MPNASDIEFRHWYEDWYVKTERECTALGHPLGFNPPLLNSLESLHAKPRLMVATLNPAGNVDYPEHRGMYRYEQQNAYLDIDWIGHGIGQAPLQKQIQAVFEYLRTGIGTDRESAAFARFDVVTTQFVPFRSPSEDSLYRSEDSIEFSRSMWRALFRLWLPQAAVTIGRTAAVELGNLLGHVKTERFIPSGWGTYTLGLRQFESGTRLVSLPHLSRFSLFGRRQSEPYLQEAFGWLTSAVRSDAILHSAGGLRATPIDIAPAAGKLHECAVDQSRKGSMYTAEISRSNPTALLFVVDQSSSMADKLAASEMSKAARVADVLNRTLATLITRCTKAEGTRNYFDIGIIRYGGDTASNGFEGSLGGSIFNPIANIEGSPLRIEERERRMDDGAGGIVTNKINFPVWFDPQANGGTPMCKAITLAAEALAAWCDAHPNSYPPTVLHITDGESTDGDPEELGQQLKLLATNDGQLLMFTCHVSSSASNPIQFPASEAGLPDAYAKLLFRMSSPLPDHLVKAAQQKGAQVALEARGFFFNADTLGIVDFFDIGTRASQLR